MRILFHDPFVGSDHPVAQELGAQAVDLDTLLAESDFVSIHVPLMPETYHLIDAWAFKTMKPSAILVNTARGPVVDPEALYQALKEGEIAYAALDVTEPEPIEMDSPLLDLPNCIVVPHIASGSIVTRTRMAEIAARNLIAGVRGEPLPAWVNPEVGQP
jgi:glyoxylate reductase